MRLRVAGIAESPEEIVLDEGFEQSELIATPAFLRRHPQADAGFFGILTRLRRGAADIPVFKRAVQALPHEGAIEFQTTSVTEAKVARGYDHRWVRSACSRWSSRSPVSYWSGRRWRVRRSSIPSTTRRSALGFGRRQLVAVAVLRAGVVAIAAAVLAVAIAVAVSPLTPIGVARDADPDLGFFVDRPVVLLGALAVFVAVIVLATLPAWWYTRGAQFRTADRPAARTSRLVGWLSWAGAPLTAGTGVRMALEPGRGRTAVPVRTTIVGAALAIATVVAALTFASSLDHLVSTPRLYGWSWDARVSAGGDTPESAAALHAKLADLMANSESVHAFSESVISRVNLDGVTVTALGVAHREGAVGPTIVDGRAPRTDDEVALGAKTLDLVGVGIGDTVRRESRRGGQGPDAPRGRARRVAGARHLPRLGQDRAR